MDRIAVGLPWSRRGVSDAQVWKFKKWTESPWGCLGVALGLPWSRRGVSDAQALKFTFCVVFFLAFFKIIKKCVEVALNFILFFTFKLKQEKYWCKIPIFIGYFDI